MLMGLLLFFFFASACSLACLNAQSLTPALSTSLALHLSAASFDLRSLEYICAAGEPAIEPTGRQAKKQARSRKYKKEARQAGRQFSAGKEAKIQRRNAKKQKRKTRGRKKEMETQRKDKKGR
ncbi:hypothetical protein MGYG_08908 [Nannizzia gypsea CBS 118893]|uniref:Uncharacterized protein n=1 Tax=Arthroderma gypseum (strain ATCC MYA-4604 / CBS 118893) TaxID=535722 RepID=E5R2E1_ARTGP|nr:hypothetical protein MGYG_08908 [Nannizzia gypsea CBS 118893]EFQ97817.1 hypothetical protein MGYG_08908 [Nannizzia gypsea CBS 118893]